MRAWLGQPEPAFQVTVVVEEKKRIRQEGGRSRQREKEPWCPRLQNE